MPVFFLHAQPLTVAQADSLRLFLRTSQADTIRVRSLLRLSGHYQGRTLNYLHNLDTALVLANQAQALSQQLRYDTGHQEALFQQGRIFIKQEKLSQVKKMLPTVDAITRIRLLLELGKSKLRPTYSQEAKPDSALLVFSQAERLSRRMNNRLWQEESQLLTGVAYLFKGDCERSRVWFRRVIGARQRAGDQAGELQAWLRWALTQYTESKCIDKSDSLSRAFTLARQLGNRPNEAFLLVIIGIKYSDEGNLRQGEREVLKALSIQKTIGYPTLNQAYHALVEQNDYLQHPYLDDLLTIYSSLADISAMNANVTKSVFYNMQAVKDLERSGLQEDLDWPYFWLGNKYFDMGQYAKGLVYYQQSLAVSRQKGQVVVFIGLIRRMAKSLIEMGRTKEALHLLNEFTNQHLPLTYDDKMVIALGFGQCYAALKQDKLAENYYLEAVAWDKKNGEVLRSFIWLNLSNLYVTSGQYTKAMPYLKRLVISYPGNDLIGRIQIYFLQSKVDSAQANYSSALRYYQRYSALKDSLLNEKSSQQMAELDIRYQSHQKEQALQLRQKDIRMLTQQNHAQQTQRNAFIGGTLLLAALLGVSYNRYRLKQRSNQLLEAQQRILQAHQQEIDHKNESLSLLVSEKNSLLVQKDNLLVEQERLLKEKERLLLEIHHRVKNNLQVVMSLLNSQANYLSDQGALSAIQQSQHRVQAMALIHQKLYQSEGISRIPMPDYIAELVAYLHESFTLPQSIDIKVAIDPIELDVTQAVPLGLIINEAITNALKYAFPKGRTGRVAVGLHQLNGLAYELVIADDGVGLPADFDPIRSRSLGLTLIRGFSEQLSGQLQISGHPGLSIRLLFHDEAYTVNPLVEVS